jgi:hypothetical protein
VMSEVLLQTIVEKLEALEIALLKPDNPRKIEEASSELTTAFESVQSGLRKLNAEARKNNDCVNNLSKEINALSLNFFNHKQNQVKHIHHLHKHIWISLTLFMISLLFAYGWIDCITEKKQFEANDIQYRFWKANGNTSLLKIIYHTDSLYNRDKTNFTNKVLQAEHKIAERTKIERLAGEKKK